MNVILPVSVLKCVLKWMDEYPVSSSDKVILKLIDPQLKKIGGLYKFEFSSDKKFITIKTEYL